MSTVQDRFNNSRSGKRALHRRSTLSRTLVFSNRSNSPARADALILLPVVREARGMIGSEFSGSARFTSTEVLFLFRCCQSRHRLVARIGGRVFRHSP